MFGFLFLLVIMLISVIIRLNEKMNFFMQFIILVHALVVFGANGAIQKVFNDDTLQLPKSVINIITLSILVLIFFLVFRLFVNVFGAIIIKVITLINKKRGDSDDFGIPKINNKYLQKRRMVRNFIIAIFFYFIILVYFLISFIIDRVKIFFNKFNKK